MQPNFQNSFIPKKPIDNTPDRPSGTNPEINIFSLAATIVFICMALLFGGLYFYKTILVKNLATAKEELESARSAIEPENIQKILDANSRITTSVGLLEKHLTTSKLLVFLGDSVVRKMKFTDLLYTNKDGIPTITINSEVQTYNAFAYQESVFSQNELVKFQDFSGISLAENGNIKFKFTARLDPSLVSYKKSLESINTEQ